MSLCNEFTFIVQFKYNYGSYVVCNIVIFLPSVYVDMFAFYNGPFYRCVVCVGQ